jgi:putative tricarboxylic transport membrane protein
VVRLNAEINRLLVEPDIKAKLVDAGAEVAPMSVDQFEEFVRTEVVKFAAIIKDAGIQPE